jgi:hypothetical protein
MKTFSVQVQVQVEKVNTHFLVWQVNKTPLEDITTALELAD